MSEHEPTGPASTADGELDRLLETARAVAPSAARVTKIGGALGVGAAPAAKSSLGLSLALAVGVVAVAALWWLASPSENAAAPNTAPAARDFETTPVEPAPPLPEPIPQVASLPPVPAIAPALGGQDAPTATPRTVAAPLRGPHPHVADAPAAPTVAEPAPTPAWLAPAAAPAERAPGPTEASLLMPARAALARAPARTLTLCAQHAELFPNGALAEERDVLAIEALAGLGRTGEARARADAFRRAHPGSAHLERIARVLGD